MWKQKHWVQELLLISSYDMYLSDYKAQILLDHVKLWVLQNEDFLILNGLGKSHQCKSNTHINLMILPL